MLEGREGMIRVLWAVEPRSSPHNFSLLNRSPAGAVGKATARRGVDLEQKRGWRV